MKWALALLGPGKSNSLGASGHHFKGESPYFSGNPWGTSISCCVQLHWVFSRVQDTSHTCLSWRYLSVLSMTQSNCFDIFSIPDFSHNYKTHLFRVCPLPPSSITYNFSYFSWIRQTIPGMYHLILQNYRLKGLRNARICHPLCCFLILESFYFTDELIHISKKIHI